MWHLKGNTMYDKRLLYSSGLLMRDAFINKKCVKVEENTYKNQKMTTGEHQGIPMRNDC